MSGNPVFSLFIIAQIWGVLPRYFGKRDPCKFIEYLVENLLNPFQLYKEN